MKILAAGDLHGDINAAKKLAEKAKKQKVDLVVLSGDFNKRINWTIQKSKAKSFNFTWKS